MKQQKNIFVLVACLFLALVASATNCKKAAKERSKRPESSPTEKSAAQRAAEGDESEAPRKGDLARTPDVNFVPTPQVAVDKMLELAELKPGEIHYDLGCGDGRIVVTSAKRYGVKAKGFDIDPQRVKESKENVEKNKVGHLVTIKHADIFTVDLSEADVVTLYLLPELNVDLMPQLKKLKKGARIISYEFDMKGARPALVHKDKFGGETEHTIYKWVVPWEAETGAE